MPLSRAFSARQAQTAGQGSPVGKIRILDFYHFPLSLSG